MIKIKFDVKTLETYKTICVIIPRTFKILCCSMFDAIDLMTNLFFKLWHLLKQSNYFVL